MIRAKSGDFTKGSVSSNVLRLAIPIIVAELVQVAYNIVDRMYIGHIPGCGTDSLTGIGLVLPLITITSAFSNLCCLGGATISAVARGEKNDEKARMVMENAFTLLVICGLLLIALFRPFSEKIIMWLGGDEVTTFYACEYFDIYVLGTVCVLISLGMNSFINMQGYSLIGMCTVLIGAVLNIILDPVFIFVLDMGIKGAAIATVISQVCSAIWVVLFLRRKDIPLRLTALRVDPKITGEIMKLGLSGFMFKATNSVTQGVVNSTLRLFGGTLANSYIASMSIIHSIREVAFQPVHGFVEGAKPVLSYNYGAGENARVNETIKLIHFVGFSFTTLCWFFFMFCPTALIKIFSNDPQLIEICKPCVRYFFMLFPFMPLQTSGQNTFVALKYPGYPIVFALLRKIFLILPLTIILPRIGLGVMGVFIAESVSEIVSGTACHLTMCFKVWNPIKKKLKSNI